MSDISFRSISFDCAEAILEGTSKTARVVVSPIRVIQGVEAEGRDEFIVLYGCNMYRSCIAPNCLYSSISREQARERRRERGDGVGNR